MKKVSLVFATLIVATIAIAAVPAYAQQADVMTDQHIDRIKNSCQSALATLNQIHANDAPVYINRNQAYFSISDKLIARFNSRLALNSYDTTGLVKIASEYNDALTEFRSAYKQYDNAMADLTKMNCSRQPVGFYDKVTDVRGLRANVKEAVEKLHKLIAQYSEAVDTFKAQHETKLRSSAND